LSRCQRFDFRRIPASEIAAHLRHIVESEGFQAEDEALLAIARSAQGCMRDAVSLLDQMLSFGAEAVTLAQVQQVLGSVSAQAVDELVEALAGKDVARGLRLIQQLVLEGASLTEFCHQVMEHLRGVMVLQMAQDPSLLDELPVEAVRQMQGQAQRMALPATIFAIKRFGEAIPQLKGGYQPQLPLELALIEATQGAPAAVPAAPSAPAPSAVPAQATPPAGSKSEAKPPTDKPAPVQTEEAPVAAPPPLDHAAVQRLRTRWKDFLAAVRQRCGIRVEAALKSVRDVAVADQSVALAFGNNDFTHQMISQSETRGQLAAILSDILGRPVQLECQMGEQARLSGRIAVTAVQENKDGHDPLVEYAVSALGAQVID
jgi:DNA polymerase-3 subunit gamma/tau